MLLLFAGMVCVNRTARTTTIRFTDAGVLVVELFSTFVAFPKLTCNEGRG
jgi:hypothetical protein